MAFGTSTIISLVSIVRITYHVTCLNKLQYEGRSYFFSDPHKLNESYSPSEGKIEEFKSHAHEWVENLGGDQWRFVLDASDSVLKARSVFPGLDGWQIRLHYGDWSGYRHLNDWSADFNVGMPGMNRKIVIYDNSGKVLWGVEPEIFRSSRIGIFPVPGGTLSWKDASPWETSVFRPQVTVSNTGEVSLRDYHARMWFRVPVGKSLSRPVDDWYTPESTPSLSHIGGNVWELDILFDRHILYVGDTVTEGNIGLHLNDWSDFDKTVCGIALLDSDENVIYGKIPSVESCEAYDGPNLLKMQYARRKK